MKSVRISLATLTLLASLGVAKADTIWNGTNGANLFGSATFHNVTGGTFQVDLENVSPFDVANPAQVLTGVFFDITGSPILTPGTAKLMPGSTVHFGGTDPDGVVGGEWAYNGAVGGGLPQYGISSSGLGWFGGASFPGSNLGGPAAVNGVQYGLTSIGDDPTLGNAAVTGGNALIQHGVSFTFTGLTDDFDLSRINNLYFQYGTDLSEPRFPGEPETPFGNPGPSPVPEPASMAVLGLGVVPILKKLRKRRVEASA